jgi:uncharacterized protein (DUF885 family)
MATQFRFGAKAGYDAEPLPEELSGSMTFGYYDPPNIINPIGRFLFNSNNLSQQQLSPLPCLNYHELVPGHHFHIASQFENELLPSVRKYGYFNAFNEGWAEYSATLAGELGMYAEPEAEFGRLGMDAFLTCRLIVDTGMNALGWPIEKAQAFMFENSIASELEIRTDTIRYACDIPGQALAYKLGEDYIVDLRTMMQKSLGNSFDVRDFHDVILAPGARPLAEVSHDVHVATARLKTAAEGLV